MQLYIYIGVCICICKYKSPSLPLSLSIYIYIFKRLPPLPPTSKQSAVKKSELWKRSTASQKVGWGRLLEALAVLGCSLPGFRDIWSALGTPGQRK